MNRHTNRREPHPDYGITLRDGTGRELVVAINGASIDYWLRMGVELADVIQGVQMAAFENAILSGAIGADARIVTVEHVER